MNDFVLVRKNLFRRKLRAILMIVSILVAFMIFGVLAGFYRAFNAGEDRAAADRLIIVNKINFTQPMPIAYFNRVRSVEGVRQVTFANWFGGYYQEPKNFIMALAVEPNTYFDVYRSELDIAPDAAAGVHPRPRRARWSARRWRTSGAGRSATACRCRATSSPRRAAAHTWDFTIAGIVKGKAAHVDTNFLLFQYDYFDETRSFGKDTIGWMILQTTSPENNDRVAKTIDAMFANSTAETSTDTEKAFGKAFAAQLGNIALIVVAGGRRGLRHHPDDRRQHHGAVDPRAHARDRRAEDARLLGPAHPRRWCSASSSCWRCSAACRASRSPR